MAEEEIAEQKNKEETQSSYREPDREIVQSWVRMKDVPGETMLELGNNFMAAIRPYEQEALKTGLVIQHNYKIYIEVHLTETTSLNSELQQ